MAAVENLEGCIRALKKMTKQDTINIRDGVDKCLDIILRKSNYYCPVETGELRASGKKEITGTGLGTEGKVVYTAPHAIPVHEIIEAFHASPTCAKFLERAMRESKGTCTNVMKRQIKVYRS